jgi:hypothetical protein
MAARARGGPVRPWLRLFTILLFAIEALDIGIYGDRPGQPPSYFETPPFGRSGTPACRIREGQCREPIARLAATGDRFRSAVRGSYYRCGDRQRGNAGNWGEANRDDRAGMVGVCATG